MDKEFEEFIERKLIYLSSYLHMIEYTKGTPKIYINIKRSVDKMLVDLRANKVKELDGGFLTDFRKVFKSQLKEKKEESNR